MRTIGRTSARRAILARGVATAAAAAVAVGTGGQARAATTGAGGPYRALRLVGRAWHTDAATAPAKGDSYGVYGELVDDGGAKVGEFYSACVATDSPFQITGEGVGSLEFHALVLAAGSLIGIGAGTGTERAYAIVGGTGAYAGARGSYTAVQDTRGLGGNGTASFDIRLME